jgi:predicted O-methyltransferase YrrM
MTYPNWFQQEAVKFFNNYLNDYRDQSNLEFLQIGTYTGDASVWLRENVLTNPTSYLTDVDTWEGSDEAVHKEWDWQSVEQVYDEKVAKYSNVIKHKSKSVDFFNFTDKQYDFIYIDGDHTEDAVYLDACLAWPLLKSGGIMAFDDYHWNHESGLDSMRPGPAIDRFVKENKDQLEILGFGWQYWIKKK